jgi:stage II sporulation protein AA (anti-sigma F factor antagonist)
MALKLECRNDALLVWVNGDFDLVSAAEFRQRVDTALEEQGPKHLIVNMSKMTFMDSSGLGVLLGRLKQVQSRRGRMFLTGLRPEVLKILNLSGIIPLLQITRTEDEAMALLRRGAVK